AVRAAALTALRELTDRPVDFDIDAPAAQRREAAAALLGEFLPPQPATTVAP
ncbi:MAG: hypothetical protein QOE14_760, partial [Humisphaera sp.]|nr:hypothetical protein [Humisphaera sp.]